MRTQRIPRPFATVGLTWLAMLGVDLFLHAGLLAPLYDWDSPFLLAPEEAFVRIPAGYLAFLVLAAGLVWLLPRLGVVGGRDGAVIAGALGAVVWGALLLGVWSTQRPIRPCLWVGGSARAWSLPWGAPSSGPSSVAGDSGRLAWRVLALVVVLAISAVVLQSTGYATAPVLVR